MLRQTETPPCGNDLFEATGLNGSTDELESIHDIDLFLKKIAEYGARLLAVDCLGIWGVADAGGILLPQFVYGLGGEQVDVAGTTKLQPIDLTAIQRIFEKKKVIKADWARASHESELGPLIPGSKTSIIGAVCFKDRLVGLVHADAMNSMRKWTANNLTTMRLLAELCSLALWWKQFDKLEGEGRGEVEILAAISSEVLGLTEDIDSLLQLITEKARHLLNADISYITIMDKTTNKQFILVSSNAPEKWKAIKVPAYTGLAAWVYREKKPVVSMNYATDPRAVPSFIAEVEKEGLKSFLEVPLIIGDEVIGVLVMAKRLKHRFPAKDVRLASAFANLASIALQNSNFYGEQRKMSAELKALNDRLNRLNDRLNRRNEAIQRASDIHRQFIMTELQGEGVTSIVNTLARLINNPVLVEDQYGELLAVGIHEQKVDESTLESTGELGVLGLVEAYPQARQQLKLLAEKKRSVTIEIAENGINKSRLVTPIIAHSNILGYISVPVIGKKLSRLDINATEYAALVLALDMMREKSVFEAEQRAKGDFLGRLLYGDYGSEEELLKRASYLGYHLVGPRRVMVMRLDSSTCPEVAKLFGERITGRILDRLLRSVNATVTAVSPQSITIIANEDIVVFAFSEEGDEESSLSGIAERLALAIKQVPKQIHRELTASVGIGCLCQKLEDYKKSYHQAKKAVDIANWIGKRDEILPLEALGVYGLLFEPNNRERLSAFSRETLEPLVRYDREHNTSLVKTLSTYFKCSCNLKVTAGLLFVHENTARQRLERAAKQLGKADLGDADDKLTLQLALKVWEAEQHI